MNLFQTLYTDEIMLHNNVKLLTKIAVELTAKVAIG